MFPPIFHFSTALASCEHQNIWNSPRKLSVTTSSRRRVRCLSTHTYRLPIFKERGRTEKLFTCREARLYYVSRSSQIARSLCRVVYRSDRSAVSSDRRDNRLVSALAKNAWRS